MHRGYCKARCWLALGVILQERGSGQVQVATMQPGDTYSTWEAWELSDDRCGWAVKTFLKSKEGMEQRSSGYSRVCLGTWANTATCK